MRKTKQILDIESAEGRPLEEILTDLYVSQQKSSVEIANRYDVTAVTLRRWLKEFGILIRTISEARLQKYGGTKPTNQELADLYVQEKLTPAEIAEMYKVGVTSVGTWLREAEIPVRDRSEALLTKSGGKKPSEEELESLYVTKKMNLREIAEQYNVHDTTVRLWLLRLGIPIRDKTIISPLNIAGIKVNSARLPSSLKVILKVEPCLFTSAMFHPAGRKLKMVWKISVPRILSNLS